jgi:bifunctional non-homologous end joining protein LigD
MRAGVHRIDGRPVEVTSVERVLFPDEGITKGDVVGYYRDVAGVMLPHLEGRPLTLHRFPSGIAAGGFYHKDVSDDVPDWIRTVRVVRRAVGGAIEQAFVCEDAAALVWFANHGTLSFHVWPARADDLDRPDRVVFDVDPPGDGDLHTVREAVRALRDVLDRVGLVPFVQTTGSKGYHVVAPLDRTAPFDDVRSFARRVAELVAGRRPERLTTEVRKGKRAGRVFLDTNRNAYAQTFVAPYSLRARPAAPVATPLDWHELGRAEPRAYRIDNLSRRLGQKTDPWEEIDASARPLDDARRRLEQQADSG